MESDNTIEGYYHSSLEACAQASQLEIEKRPKDALTEYRRSIALIEAMRRISHAGRDIDEAYFSGAEDVEGICRVHIAKLEGELPLQVPLHRDMRRKSAESLNSMSSMGLTRSGSVPPRKEVGTPDRSRWAFRDRSERPKPSRTPSPEKKEKKPMPLSLRSSGLVLNRQSSSDSTNASVAAVEASRAAALAWQGKRPNGSAETRKTRNPSPTSSRAGSLDYSSNIQRRSLASDAASLLDAPLIDFSAPIMTSKNLPVNESTPNLQIYTPISPAPTTQLPSHPLPQPPQQSDMPSRPRRKPPPVPPKQQLSRSNATLNRSSKALKPPSPPHPRSNSAPNLLDPVNAKQELPPISVSISEDISPEQELSREEKALKELKGVDEALAKTILNDIVVRGDEVQWEDIGITTFA